MTAPDYIEPLVGWRVWVAELTMRPDSTMGLSLNSLYYARSWPIDAPVEAVCEYGGRGPCADDDHLCGIHAVRTLDLAVRYMPERLRNPQGWAFRSTQVVLGTVKLWGNVAEHEDGWRAEYAQPARVYVPSIFKARGSNIYATEARELLEDTYNVPARIFRRWDDLVDTRVAA